MSTSTNAIADNFEAGLPSGPSCSHQDIRSFVDLLAGAYFCDVPDRRAEPRIRITLPVYIHRLDEHFHRLEPSVRGVTRDLSRRGAGFVCQDPIGTKFVEFELLSPCGTSLNVTAEVLRCEPLGYYYDVGCKFVVSRANEVGAAEQLSTELTSASRDCRTLLEGGIPGDGED